MARVGHSARAPRYYPFQLLLLRPLLAQSGSLPRLALAAALWSRSAEMLPPGEFFCMHITPLTRGQET